MIGDQVSYHSGLAAGRDALGAVCGGGHRQARARANRRKAWPHEAPGALFAALLAMLRCGSGVGCRRVITRTAPCVTAPHGNGNPAIQRAEDRRHRAVVSQAPARSTFAPAARHARGGPAGHGDAARRRSMLDDAAIEESPPTCDVRAQARRQSPSPAMRSAAAAVRACAACHGAHGEGNATLEAPALAGQSDWYLVRSCTLPRRTRGASHEDDVTAPQMRRGGGSAR